MHCFDMCHNIVNFIMYSMDSQEVLDAEISARVLQLINVTDSGLHCQVYQLYELCSVKFDKY